MHRFYDLPGGAAAGMADAKMPDIQAGYEKGITNVMAGLAGLNMIYEAAGMHASLLGFCHESLIIDNDMLGQCLRCVRGIEVNEDSVSTDIMREVALGGQGHYLGHAQTLALMQKDYVYPTIGDRSSPKEWEERGRPDPVNRAIEEKERILATHFPVLIPDSVDGTIRNKFPIRLPKAWLSA